MNTVQLFGRVGGTPELRKTSNNDLVANISLATQEVWLEGERWRENTEWHRLVFWKQLAEEVVAKVKKDDYIAVEGKLQTRPTASGKVKTEIIVKRWYYHKEAV